MKRRVNAKWLFAGAGFILWGSAVFLITSTLAWFSNNVIAVDEDLGIIYRAPDLLVHRTDPQYVQ